MTTIYHVIVSTVLKCLVIVIKPKLLPRPYQKVKAAENLIRLTLRRKFNVYIFGIIGGKKIFIANFLRL